MLAVALGTTGCLWLLGGEQRVGDAAAEQVEREMGFVDDPELNAYLRQIGERLAAQSSREGPWTWNVIDDPVPNAFALPGGHIYATRGLLELVNDESELAGVIGHEIGHVLASHGNRRVTLSAPFAVITGVTSWATGIVTPRLGRAIGDAGNALSQGLVIAPYSRAQEREADRIGLELSAKAGWDPMGLSDFLNTLGRAVKLMLGKSPTPSWLDTHPATDERVTDTKERAAELERADTPPIAGTRKELLAKLDGLILGQDPAAGVIKDGVFLQPEWRIAAKFPSGWQFASRKTVAATAAPNGEALISVQMVRDGRDLQAAVQQLEKESEESIQADEVRIGGRKALRTRGEERVSGGRIYYDLVWIGAGRGVLLVASLCEASRASTWQPTFDSVLRSLRDATSSELAQVRDVRLRSTGARSGETAAQLSTRSGSVWSVEQFDVSNGLEGGGSLPSGFLAKIAKSEKYQPRSR